MRAVWCMAQVQSQNQLAVGTVMKSPLTVMELSAISPRAMTHHRDTDMGSNTFVFESI